MRLLDAVSRPWGRGTTGKPWLLLGGILLGSGPSYLNLTEEQVMIILQDFDTHLIGRIAHRIDCTIHRHVVP